MELFDALKEVEWTTRPRPLSEFVQKLKLPKTRQQWMSRVKCNIFYYRTNYALYVALLFFLRFLRHLVIFVGFALVFFSLLLMNDTFTRQLNTVSTKVFGQAAVNMRARSTGGASKQRPRGGIPRVQIFALLLGTCAALLWMVGGLLDFTWFFAVCAAFCCAHASSRSVSSKAKLANFRSEFRTAWREGGA